MQTISLTLTDEMQVRAEALAREAGIDLAELVQRLVAERLGLKSARLPLLSKEEFDSLSGCIKLSPEDQKRDYRDLANEERMRKYDRL